MRFTVAKMSRRKSKPVRHPPGVKICCFCGFPDDDEVQFGKLWTHRGIVTHYYCLLLSSNMEQNGNDNEGILGFMPRDIQKELRRGKRLSCVYCRKSGATLGCCHTRCKRVFHLPCGLQAGSLHQFFGEFRSYCVTHRLKQEIDEHIKEEASIAGSVTCFICYEDVNPQNTTRTLWAPCCRKNAWFHRKCVQRLALSAGYFFKCPLCNNKQEFQQEMLEHGIFIPNQDASWELVPNAYQELLHRHSHCDAVECLCPKGRRHTGVNAKWELVLCRLCGSQGIHKGCGHLKLTSSVWECSECIGMLRKTNEVTSRRTRQQKQITNVISEDESSGSDVSVGRNPSPLPILECQDSLPVTSIKLRPGPRSFKLQQAVQNAKRAMSTKTDTSNSSLHGNPHIVTPNNSYTNPNILSDEKYNGETSQSDYSPAKKISQSLPKEMSSTEINTSVVTNILLEDAQVKSNDNRRRDAEIILIDSDDEVEIISVKPTQNILTTKDGTKIPIHSLSEITSEPHKAEGDVKIPEFVQSKHLNSSPCHTNGSPVKNSSIESDTSTFSSTYSPKFATTIPLQVDPTHLTHFPVTNRNRIGLATEKAHGNYNSDLVIVKKVVSENPVMNLKITNVTSLRQEVFPNTIPELKAMGKIHAANDVSARDSRSDLSLNGSGTDFDLGMAAINDVIKKRKNKEYTDKTLSNLFNGSLIENCKKVRTYEPKSSHSEQTNTNMTWNINFNNANGAIPIFATSIPLTCSSNSIQFEQSATLQVKPNELQTNTKDGMRMICNLDLQKKNGFHTYPRATDTQSSVPNEINNIMDYVNLANNDRFTIGRQESSMPPAKVTNMHSSVEPKISYQLPRTNVDPINTNIAQSNQQTTINGSQHLSKSSSRYFKSQSSTQQVSSPSKNASLMSRGVYPANQSINTNIQRCKEISRTLQTSQSTPDVLFLDDTPRNCTETPTGNNGNRADVNTMSKSRNSITQLANRISIPKGCDGDAGSSPAAEAGLAHQATSGGPVNATTEPVSFNNTDAIPDARKITADYSNISNCVSATIQHHSRSKNARRSCDRDRLIPKNVPVRNLQFHVLDPKIVQIIVHDTLLLNVSVNNGNPQNTTFAEGLRHSIMKQKSLSSSTGQSNSPESKSNSMGSYHHINIYTDDDLKKTQHCIKICDTSNYRVSSTKKSHDSLVSKFSFANGDSSINAITITDSKIKAPYISRTKYNIQNMLHDSYINRASSTGNEGCRRLQRSNSITEISTMNESLICACFDVNNRNLCGLHKENLPKEQIVCSPFSNNNLNSKNLCIRRNNIFSDNNLKRVSENINKTLMKTVKYKNSCRSDVCSKTYDSVNNNAETSKSIGLNRVSKCLLESINDSSQLDLPIDCYNNFKKIVEHSSEINCNNKNLDVGVQDSLRNNHNIIRLDAKDRCNKLLADCSAGKSNRSSDIMNINESKIQSINTNHTLSTSCAVLSSKDINSEVPLRRCQNSTYKEQHNSLISESKLNTCKSGLNIKVKIDLTKIQHFINCNPKLFVKRSYIKSKRRDECKTNTLPVLIASQNFHDVKSNNRLYLFKTQRKRMHERENSYPRKRLRYKSE